MKTKKNIHTIEPAPPCHSFGTWYPALDIRRAFTLIELLIVLAIISAVVALGIPLFGVLTGARSVEAGRNVVAATVGQARTIAVNEGKYAGVLFYVDPATERTAMSIVVVTDPGSRLEDADPYDKYKSWVPTQDYFSGKPDNAQTIPTRGDRVIGLAADANTVYRAPLYPQNPLVSDYLNYFGNYRPTVRAYRCLLSHKNATDTLGVRPPRNGPFGYGGTTLPPQYVRPGAGTSSAGTAESTVAPFSNNNWGQDDQTSISRYSSSEQTLLPRGVGVQVMIQPTVRPDMASLPAVQQFQERYLRTGIIMFDPQGRLTVLKNFSLEKGDPANPLGDYLGLTATAQQIPSGVGLAVYDTQLFTTAQLSQPDYKTSQTDWLYQPAAGNQYVIKSSFTNIFGDYPTPSSAQPEIDEELWLDANATPLIINRYTGSLSEAQ